MALDAAGLKERARVGEEVLGPSCDKRKRGTRSKGLGGSIQSVGDKSRGVVSRKPSENRALRQSDPLSHMLPMDQVRREGALADECSFAEAIGN